MKKAFALFPILFIFSSVWSQNIEIKEILLNQGQVILKFNIKDPNPERKYSIHLYSSSDNFIQRLEKVSGDIGVGIPVGDNKEIIWDPYEEYGSDFKGDISLDIKASIYIPFITLDKFEDYGDTFKRGKPYPLTWSGGRGDNQLIFDLYQGERKITVLDERPNNGKWVMNIPTNVKPGKDFRLRISDKSNKDEVVYTNYFSVKRKIPLWLKSGVGLVIVGIGAKIILNESLGIPDPPEPKK